MSDRSRRKARAKKAIKIAVDSPAKVTEQIVQEGFIASDVKIPKGLEDVAEIAIQQRWQITLTGGHHHRWLSPSGTPVFTGSTPSDPRAILNHISNLIKHGLRLPARRR